MQDLPHNKGGVSLPRLYYLREGRSRRGGRSLFCDDSPPELALVLALELREGRSLRAGLSLDEDLDVEDGLDEPLPPPLPPCVDPPLLPAKPKKSIITIRNSTPQILSNIKSICIRS